jgi:uncharacterized protein (DUF305 family)
MRKILIAAAIAAFPLTAHVQEGHSMPGDMTLPKACEAAAGSMDMSKMTGGKNTSMSGMDEAQTANHRAMMQMHGPMMKAAMIKDPDLAFNCGMIAHHQGAIAMSEVELKMGKDEQSKKMAQMIIDAQKQEIVELTARVEALAK